MVFFLLEPDWLHFFSGLQDYSEYSGRSLQQSSSLDGLESSSDFQTFVDCSKRTNYNWYHRHPRVRQLS